MIDNPTLLSLHARQQNPVYKGENKVEITGWMKALARALTNHLGNSTWTLLKTAERKQNFSRDNQDKCLSIKLDELSRLLNLYPYTTDGKYMGKLKPISHDEIKPALVICPESIVCEDTRCQPRCLLQKTKPRDIPEVVLIKGTDIYSNVPVLTGHCPSCESTYSADHERFLDHNTWQRVYINSAKYLKVGQNLWVD